jgi:hypothetical protein
VEEQALKENQGQTTISGIRAKEQVFFAVRSVLVRRAEAYLQRSAENVIKSDEDHYR